MDDFLVSSELWSNVLGGVASAIILAGIYWVVNYSKRKNLTKLIIIEEQIIALMTEAEENQFKDIDQWPHNARKIHKLASETAKKISPSAGALIEIVDGTLSGYPIEIYYPILVQTNERIRKILEAHI